MDEKVTTCNVDEEKEKEEKPRQENEIVKEEEIKKILEESGIQSYELQVLKHLADYIDHYTSEILNNASTFMKHAGREAVDVADIKLAIDVVAKKNPSKRLSTKELLKLAHEHNKERFPDCSGKSLLLPNDDYTLAKCNYKLKSTNSQFPVNIPMVDITNRQNQIVTLNTHKNHATVSTVIRTTSGNAMSVNVPLNLAPQRIILKPQTSNLNSVICTSHNKIDDINKRMKIEENMK